MMDYDEKTDEFVCRTSTSEATSLGLAGMQALGIPVRRHEKSFESFERLNKWFDHEAKDLPERIVARIYDAVEWASQVCESHIEIMALVKMMSVKVPNGNNPPCYPMMSLNRENKAFVTITPQVQIGRYRADFLVEGRGFDAFLVECDGQDFHDRLKDLDRDLNIYDEFKMLTFRLRGNTIWSHDYWLKDFEQWCTGNQSADMMLKGAL